VSTLLAWIMAGLVLAGMALVGRWYWLSPRAWPETAALLLHVGCCAALCGLLYGAARAGAEMQVAGGMLVGGAVGAWMAVVGWRGGNL